VHCAAEQPTAIPRPAGENPPYEQAEGVRNMGADRMAVTNICLREGASREGQYVDTGTAQYYEAIQEQWPNILALCVKFADKKPVMLLDMQDGKIYAYPYQEFKDDLNERSRLILERDYNAASLDGSMVIFVRDNEERKLVSYKISIDKNMNQ
jgi:hypothetical protein